jgi:IS6 family transposase
MPTRPRQGRQVGGPAAPPHFIPGNNTIETDHGRLKARLRPMRGLKRSQSLQTVAIGSAFVQNRRRGHYELGIDHAPNERIGVAFDELALSL